MYFASNRKCDLLTSPLEICVCVYIVIVVLLCIVVCCCVFFWMLYVVLNVGVVCCVKGNESGSPPLLLEMASPLFNTHTLTSLRDKDLKYNNVCCLRQNMTVLFMLVIKA